MKTRVIFFGMLLLAFSAWAEEKNTSFFVGAGPMLLVNTDASKNSAPSPIMFGGTAGATLFQNAVVSFQPKLTFFTNYYLWNENGAHPAETENRTAYALSFLLDMDAVKLIRHGKNLFQVGGGISLLARFAVLANGVSSHEAGGTLASNAGDDVDAINDWFWSGTRFLYPNLTFCWLYTLPNGWHAGVNAQVYVPLGSLMHGNGVDALVGSLTFRLAF